MAEEEEPRDSLAGSFGGATDERWQQGGCVLPPHSGEQEGIHPELTTDIKRPSLLNLYSQPCLASEEEEKVAALPRACTFGHHLSN